MLPPTGIVQMCCYVPFLYLKTLKTGIRFKISSLIGQYLEICVCPWELARTFCCHFMRFFHWLIGPKLICVNVLRSPPFTLITLWMWAGSCVFLPFTPITLWMWAGSCVEGPWVSVLWSWSLEFCCLGCMSLMSFLWCWCWSWFGVVEFEGCLWFVFLSYCGVSSGVRGWSCVVVLCVRVIICFCHLCHCVFRFLVSPILVNHFCCLLCFSFLLF